VKHVAIAELHIRHAYYADGTCSDFAIEPSDETDRLLRNHRCQIGPLADGFRILTQLGEDGQPFLPMPADTVLVFHLRLRNSEFSLFTDLSEISGRAAPIFTNFGAPTGAEGTLRLAADRAAPARPGAGIFASLEIHLLNRAHSTPPLLGSFELAFKAKRLRWVYYCITDVTATTSELRIIDASPAGSRDVLQFGDAGRTRLDDHPDPADPIAVQLVGRYPAMRCVRLISDEPVACRQEPRKYLELRLGDERLAGPLPNPSLRDAGKDDVLFRIVKYRTQPFQHP